MSISNPMVPYVGPIMGGVQPGKVIYIDGHVPLHANRFAVNIQCGPHTSPRDDVAFHINVDFLQNKLVRNSILQMNWGREESHGYLPLARGQPFSMAILCDAADFKLAINGNHFTEMSHRMPLHRVTHLAIDGDVIITQIQYFGGSGVPPSSMSMSGMGAPVGFTPGMSPANNMPYPPQSQPFAMNKPYPVQQGGMDFYNSYLHGGSNHNHGYHPSGPGYPSSYGYPSGPGYHSGHGGAMLGGATGLGAGLAGAALAHKLSPKKALKSQKKAAKKALKYGVPLAGLGVGAYTVGRILHRSSSSSSSSSSD